MTYPVTVFRWDDPGAPQLPSTGCSANDMKAVLKACLITGYGAKLPLGWLEIFDDSLGYVLQNKVADGGSGMMVRLWPSSGSWTSALTSSFSACLLLQSAKTYSASNSPLFPSQVNMSWASQQTAGVTKSWILIGTAIGFYLLIGHYSASINTTQYTQSSVSDIYSFSMYVGDIVDTIPNDAYPFVVVTKNHNSDIGDQAGANIQGGLDTLYNDFSNSIGGIKMYEADGGTAFTKYGVRQPFTQCGATGFAATGQNDLVVAGGIYLTKNLQSSQDNTVTNKLPEIRGRLPGILVTLMGDGGTVTRWPMAPRSIGGVAHQLIRGTAVSQLSNRWINLVDW